MSLVVGRAKIIPPPVNGDDQSNQAQPEHAAQPNHLGQGKALGGELTQGIGNGEEHRAQQHEEYTLEKVLLVFFGRGHRIGDSDF